MRILILISLFCVSLLTPAFNQTEPDAITWKLSKILKSKDSNVEVAGSPSIIKSKYGKAVEFNGETDGVWISEMPLKGQRKFTVEAIFKPYSGGNFEQRFLHIGEARGSRILLEIRATETEWYFDAFVKAGEQDKALIDSTLLHPLDKWYHVAFVIDEGQLTSFVNGKKELEFKLDLNTTIDTGKTSMGTRIDKRSWFKGAIYKARVTSKALEPEDFLEF